MKSYDIGQVVVVFGDLHLAGYAEDDCVNVEYDEDQFSLKVGADGEGCRSKNNNQSATVRVKLLGSSSSNDALSAVAIADRLTNAGLKPLVVRDASGTSLHAAEQAYIQRMPASPFGKEIGDREWVFRTDKLVSNVGGSNV